ncbi:hypothetical protein BP6252_08218 [Coleophoma cylindrospora]|uniref:Transcription factor domain-containing protein n=1 Tax=Coleophoma cylindrospora TaxID=1849047 RepID=A0A3D8R5F0_9HELO|nr:hypothetical protein BP6252_08218 [Coleophoma cylindrospora]
MFTNEQEYCCFKIFCEKTALRLAGCFDSSLWGRLVLQACDTDPAIRHAVIAIGALDFTLELAHAEPIPAKSPLNMHHKEVQKHHSFALRQYGAAIRQIRNSASEAKVNTRRILLGCLLISCFEMFQGNYHSAVTQIQSGLVLMENWQTDFATNQSEVLGASSPSPYEVENELYQAFARLDIQLMSFVDFRPRETHERMRHFGSTSVQSMPSTFRDLKESRIYIEIIIRRIMHYIGSVSGSKSYNGCLRVASPPLLFQSDSQEVHRMLSKEPERWYQAFKPLWEHACSPDGKAHIHMATALRIYYLISQFSIGIIPMNRSETIPFAAKASEICREIVSLAPTIINYSATRCSTARFSFDLQAVTPLYIVALRCPDPDVRCRALNLLRSCSRREGLWDSHLVANVLSWVTKLEGQDGLKGISATNGPGVTHMMYDFEFEAKYVQVKCQQLGKGSKRPVERILKMSID